MRMRVSLILILTIALLYGCSKPDQPTMNLSRAVQLADLNQIKRNLYWGSDINISDSAGQTPLHLAAKKGRPIVVELLLDKGAQPNAKNNKGQSPLDLALIDGRTQVAKLLVNQGAEIEPNKSLFDMAIIGIEDRDVLHFLLNQGAKLETTDENGNTPLHIATNNNFRRTAKSFIDQGAEVNALNSNGETPLTLATKVQHQDLIKLLQKNGGIDSQAQ